MESVPSDVSLASIKSCDSLQHHERLNRLRNKTGIFNYSEIFSDDKGTKTLWDTLVLEESNS